MMMRFPRDIAYLLMDEQDESLRSRNVLEAAAVKYAIIPCAVLQEPILVAGERLYHGIEAIAKYAKSRQLYPKAV